MVIRSVRCCKVALAFCVDSPDEDEGAGRQDRQTQQGADDDPFPLRACEGESRAQGTGLVPEEVASLYTTFNIASPHPAPACLLSFPALHA